METTQTSNQLCAIASDVPTDLIFGDSRIRVVFDDNKQPWFIVKDVCDALGLTNSRHAVVRLDQDEKSMIDIKDAMLREQSMTIVSISGLYSLVLSCRKPNARPFKRWVTHDVIPYILQNKLLQRELEERMNEPAPLKEAMSDFIYVASSDMYASEHIYKVGYTSNVQARLVQLNTSHTMGDSMCIIKTWATNDGAGAEKLIHQKLDQYRMSPRREFFQTQITVIIQVISDCICT